MANVVDVEVAVMGVVEIPVGVTGDVLTTGVESPVVECAVDVAGLFKEDILDTLFVEP